MTLHGLNFIAQNLSAGSGVVTRPVSPLGGAALEPGFHAAGEAEVNAALMAAEEAFVIYRSVSGAVRAAFLEQIAQEILNLGEPLIERGHLETGLPTTRLVAERGRTVGQLRMFAQVAREGSWVDARIDRAQPERQPLPKPDLRRMLIPMGPVIVFGSSNFPLAFSVAGGDTASALATGNPVVVKAHSGHPGTSELVATAIRRAVEAQKLPPGVFSMLHGPGKVIGPALVRHPLAQAAGFTGSREAGRALFDAASARPDPIPVFAEMSSLNPVFVLPGALSERGAQIADGLRTSVTMGVGQFCTKPGLVFGVNSAEFEGFQTALAAAMEQVAPAPMLHAGICGEYHAGLERVMAIPGVQAVAVSRDKGDSAQTHGEARVFRTDLGNFLANPGLAEEVFGPMTLLIGAPGLADLEKVAAGLDGQLTATLHGTPADLAGATTLVRILERKAGRLLVNGFPTGVEVCPSMQHGGPSPATTDARFTSVGTAALLRFVRPVAYQNFPEHLLPEALHEANPLRLWRVIDGVLTAPQAA